MAVSGAVASVVSPEWEAKALSCDVGRVGVVGGGSSPADLYFFLNVCSCGERKEARLHGDWGGEAGVFRVPLRASGGQPPPPPRLRRECGQERPAQASTPEATGDPKYGTQNIRRDPDSVPSAPCDQAVKPRTHEPPALTPAGEVGISTLGATN